jgi:hypothetical protein
VELREDHQQDAATALKIVARISPVQNGQVLVEAAWIVDHLRALPGARSVDEQRVAAVQQLVAAEIIWTGHSNAVNLAQGLLGLSRREEPVFASEVQAAFEQSRFDPERADASLGLWSPTQQDGFMTQASQIAGQGAAPPADDTQVRLIAAEIARGHRNGSTGYEAGKRFAAILAGHLPQPVVHTDDRSGANSADHTTPERQDAGAHAGTSAEAASPTPATHADDDDLPPLRADIEAALTTLEEHPRQGNNAIIRARRIVEHLTGMRPVTGQMLRLVRGTSDELSPANELGLLVAAEIVRNNYDMSGDLAHAGEWFAEILADHGAHPVVHTDERAGTTASEDSSPLAPVSPEPPAEDSSPLAPVAPERLGASTNVLDAVRRRIRPHTDGLEGLLGPDPFGVRHAPAAPDFLAGYDYSKLNAGTRAAFFRAIDMVRPDAPDATDLLPKDLDTSTVSEGVTVSRTSYSIGRKVQKVPHLAVSIWFGGPLYDDGGSRAEFMTNVADAARGSTSFDFILLTDVSRAEFNTVRTAREEDLSGRALRVQQMLRWAEAHNIRLVNVDEVFNAEHSMPMDGAVRTERARNAWAAASDFVRLWWLYRFGGVYSDGDNRLTGDLRRAAVAAAQSKHGLAVGKERAGQLVNAVLAAAAGSPGIKHYLDVVNENYKAPFSHLMIGVQAPDADPALLPPDFHTPLNQQNLIETEADEINGQTVSKEQATAAVETVIRTGPNRSTFDRVAQRLGMQNRTELPLVPADVYRVESSQSWITPRGTATNQPPVDTETLVNAITGAVTSLHRETRARQGGIYLPAAARIIDRLPAQQQLQAWETTLQTFQLTITPGTQLAWISGYNIDVPRRTLRLINRLFPEIPTVGLTEDPANSANAAATTPGSPSPLAPLASTRSDGDQNMTPAASEASPGETMMRLLAQAPAESRSHTWFDPASTRPVKSAFDVRRVEHNGERITELTVTVDLRRGTGTSDDDVQQTWQRLTASIETFFNQPQHHFTNGDVADDLLRVNVTPARTGQRAHLTATVVPYAPGRLMSQHTWIIGQRPVYYAHEIAHQLGARDESRETSRNYQLGDTTHTITRTAQNAGSLLGNFDATPEENLPQAGLRQRHLDLFATLIGDITPYTGRVQAVVAAARSLEGSLRWRGGTELDNQRWITEEDTGWGFPDDFARWIHGTGNEPTEQSTMNCWEAVLFAAYRAEVVDKRWLEKIHRDASNAATNVDATVDPLTIYPYEGYSANEAAFHAALIRGMVSGGLQRYEINRETGIGTTDIPAGHLVFFGGLGGHVALSLGTRDAQNRQQVLSLWNQPNGISTGSNIGYTISFMETRKYGFMQVTSVEELIDEGLFMSGVVVEFAAPKWQEFAISGAPETRTDSGAPHGTTASRPLSTRSDQPADTPAAGARPSRPAGAARSRRLPPAAPPPSAAPPAAPTSQPARRVGRRSRPLPPTAPPPGALPPLPPPSTERRADVSREDVSSAGTPRLPSTPEISPDDVSPLAPVAPETLGGESSGTTADTATATPPEESGVGIAAVVASTPAGPGALYLVRKPRAEHGGVSVTAGIIWLGIWEQVAADFVPPESVVSWREWHVLPKRERDRDKVYVRTDELSQLELHQLTYVMVKEDRNEELAGQVQEYAEWLDQQERANPRSLDRVIWTGEEIVADGERLGENLDRLTSVLQAGGPDDEVRSLVAGVASAADRVDAAINGFVRDSAVVGGTYRLRNRFVPLVGAARNLVAAIERAGRDGLVLADGARPVSAETLGHLAEVVREFRRRAAFEPISAGEYWREDHPELDDLTRQERRAFIESLSRANLENLREATADLLERDDFRALYERVMALPLRLKHSTSAYHAIAQSGTLSSLKDLGRRGNAVFGSAGGTSPEDSAYLRNDDFVFFRVDASDAAPQTRYGSTTIALDFENFERLGGWISLHDQLEPLSASNMQIYVHNGVTVRTAKYNIASYYDDPLVSWTYTYQPGQATEETRTVEFQEEVFYGDDAREGLALSILREVDLIGGQFQQDLFNASGTDELWYLISRLFRPEAKIPSGPLAQAADGTSPHDFRPLNVRNPDGDSLYRPDGTINIPSRTPKPAADTSATTTTEPAQAGDAVSSPQQDDLNAEVEAPPEIAAQLSPMSVADVARVSREHRIDPNDLWIFGNALPAIFSQPNNENHDPFKGVRELFTGYSDDISAFANVAVQAGVNAEDLAAVLRSFFNRNYLDLDDLELLPTDVLREMVRGELSSLRDAAIRLTPMNTREVAEMSGWLGLQPALLLAFREELRATFTQPRTQENLTAGIAALQSLIQEIGTFTASIPVFNRNLRSFAEAAIAADVTAGQLIEVLGSFGAQNWRRLPLMLDGFVPVVRDRAALLQSALEQLELMSGSELSHASREFEIVADDLWIFGWTLSGMRVRASDADPLTEVRQMLTRLAGPDEIPTFTAFASRMRTVVDHAWRSGWSLADLERFDPVGVLGERPVPKPIVCAGYGEMLDKARMDLAGLSEEEFTVWMRQADEINGDYHPPLPVDMNEVTVEERALREGVALLVAARLYADRDSQDMEDPKEEARFLSDRLARKLGTRRVTGGAPVGSSRPQVDPHLFGGESSGTTADDVVAGGSGSYVGEPPRYVEGAPEYTPGPVPGYVDSPVSPETIAVVAARLRLDRGRVEELSRYSWFDADRFAALRDRVGEQDPSRLAEWVERIGRIPRNIGRIAARLPLMDVRDVYEVSRAFGIDPRHLRLFNDDLNRLSNQEVDGVRRSTQPGFDVVTEVWDLFTARYGPADDFADFVTTALRAEVAPEELRRALDAADEETPALLDQMSPEDLRDWADAALRFYTGGSSQMTVEEQANQILHHQMRGELTVSQSGKVPDAWFADAAAQLEAILHGTDAGPDDRVRWATNRARRLVDLRHNGVHDQTAGVAPVAGSSTGPGTFAGERPEPSEDELQAVTDRLAPMEREDVEWVGDYFGLDPRDLSIFGNALPDLYWPHDGDFDPVVAVEQLFDDHSSAIGPFVAVAVRAEINADEMLALLESVRHSEGLRLGDLQRMPTTHLTYLGQRELPPWREITAQLAPLRMGEVVRISRRFSIEPGNLWIFGNELPEAVSGALDDGRDPMAAVSDLFADYSDDIAVFTTVAIRAGGITAEDLAAVLTSFLNTDYLDLDDLRQLAPDDLREEIGGDLSALREAAARLAPMTTRDVAEMSGELGVEVSNLWVFADRLRAIYAQAWTAEFNPLSEAREQIVGLLQDLPVVARDIPTFTSLAVAVGGTADDLHTVLSSIDGQSVGHLPSMFDELVLVLRERLIQLRAAAARLAPMSTRDIARVSNAYRIHPSHLGVFGDQLSRIYTRAYVDGSDPLAEVRQMLAGYANPDEIATFAAIAFAARITPEAMRSLAGRAWRESNMSLTDLQRIEPARISFAATGGAGDTARDKRPAEDDEAAQEQFTGRPDKRPRRDEGIEEPEPSSQAAGPSNGNAGPSAAAEPVTIPAHYAERFERARELLDELPAHVRGYLLVQAGQINGFYHEPLPINVNAVSADQRAMHEGVTLLVAERIHHDEGSDEPLQGAHTLSAALADDLGTRRRTGGAPVGSSRPPEDPHLFGGESSGTTGSVPPVRPPRDVDTVPEPTAHVGEEPAPVREDTDLVSLLREAGLSPIADYLEAGEVPQVQLAEGVQRPLSSPATADVPLSRAVDALIASPQVQVVDADGRPVSPAPDADETGWTAVSRWPDALFLIRTNGSVSGPFKFDWKKSSRSRPETPGGPVHCVEVAALEAAVRMDW